MALKKTGSRKAQAKKANAPMKNAPGPKSPRSEAKAAASKAAKTMAKLVKPTMRKSAAKRVEGTEVRAAVAVSPVTRIQREGFPAAKKRMDEIMKVLRADCRDVAAGAADEQQFQELIIAISRAFTNTKKKHGIDA